MVPLCVKIMFISSTLLILSTHGLSFRIPQCHLQLMRDLITIIIIIITIIIITNTTKTCVFPSKTFTTLYQYCQTFKIALVLPELTEPF